MAVRKFLIWFSITLLNRNGNREPMLPAGAAKSVCRFCCRTGQFYLLLTRMEWNIDTGSGTM